MRWWHWTVIAVFMISIGALADSAEGVRLHGQKEVMSLAVELPAKNSEQGKQKAVFLKNKKYRKPLNLISVPKQGSSHDTARMVSQEKMSGVLEELVAIIRNFESSAKTETECENPLLVKAGIGSQAEKLWSSCVQEGDELHKTLKSWFERLLASF